MLWQFVIGPAGVIFFALSLVLLSIGTLLRERNIPAEGTAERWANLPPLFHIATATAVVCGAVVTILRMGAMT